MTNVNQNTEIHNTVIKLGATFAACAGAAAITLPAEILQTKWRFQHLQELDPQSSQMSMMTRTYIQKQMRIITPLLRLTSNEIATTALTHTLENQTKHRFGEASIKTQVLAGIIAGVSHALILCPTEASKAYRLAHAETEELQRSFLKRFKSWFVFRDPKARLHRAYRGIGIRAAREVVCNVTFFPLFHELQRFLADDRYLFFIQKRWIGDETPDKETSKPNPLPPMILSGLAAGMVCAIVVTPMDALVTYYLCSREEWSLWSGKKLVTPPISLLFRGVSLQALVGGPVFGMVACIYELF